MNADISTCGYCRKTRPKTEMKEAEIIYRGRVNGKPATLKKKNSYCADKACAAHDQMAHEG